METISRDKTSRQEKIRKGLISTLGEVQADMALSYLHSQGAAIKVEGELPKNPSNSYGKPALLPTDEKWRNVAFLSYNRCQSDMLKAGYTATIPLVKEVK